MVAPAAPGSGKRKVDEDPDPPATTSLGRSGLEEAICQICAEHLTVPVTIECGHNFCQACIIQRCKRVKKPSCPQCGKQFQKRAFTSNELLGRLVQTIKQLQLNPAKRRRAEGNVYAEHGKELTWFCQEDNTSVCVDCKGSPSHRSHAVIPMAQAAHQPQVKLHKDIERLKKAKEEISKLESKERNKSNDWEESVNHHSQRISSEFEKLELLLSEEKKLFPQRLEEEKRETLQKLNENVTKLSQQSSLLQQLMAEIEEKCQQPAAELLKDVKDTLARSEQVRLQEPELTADELKGVYRVPGLMEMLRQFTVDVTLDPDTAHPELVLSEDRKHVRHRDTRWDLPDNPESFDTCVSVLGAEGFPGGRRYWEVEVGDKTRWDLGICRESVSRKGQVTLSPEDGYWAVWLRYGEFEALTSSSTILPVSVRPSRVGIFLDYEAGEVSFYNVTDRSQLCTVTGTFSGMLRPYFCPCLNAGGKNAAPLIICSVPAQAGGNLCR